MLSVLNVLIPLLASLALMLMLGLIVFNVADLTLGHRLSDRLKHWFDKKYR